MNNRVEYTRLDQMLILHEGTRLKPYVDCCGKSFRLCECDVTGRITIGNGRNIEDNGISMEECHILRTNDRNRVIREAHDAFPWFTSLSVPRQDVVTCMIFNMGLDKFKEFKRMIKAMIEGNFEKAADEMMASAWSAQVKQRAVTLSQIMRTNQYPTFT
jgi:lysozyme